MPYRLTFNDYGNKLINDTPHIWLKGFGWAAAKPAGEFKPGEKFLWNYGYNSTLVKIEKETPKTLHVIEECEGKQYPRKLLKTRWVAIGK